MTSPETVLAANAAAAVAREFAAQCIDEAKTRPEMFPLREMEQHEDLPPEDDRWLSYRFGEVSQAMVSAYRAAYNSAIHQE